MHKARNCRSKIFITCWLLAVILTGTCSTITFASTISDNAANNIRAAILITGASATAFRKDTVGLRQFGTALMLTGATTMALKTLVDAERPNGEDDDSFPSGHVSISVAGAAFLHKRYGLRFGLPAYFASALVAQNRVKNDHHHIRDVLASTVLALAITRRSAYQYFPIAADFSEGRFGFHFTIPL